MEQSLISDIRRAGFQDAEDINRLLGQVLNVHHAGRPDIFKPNAKKYTDEELLALMTDNHRPIFVATDHENRVLGYVFCVVIQHENHNILKDIKTLYIDDLCVDESLRGQHIGKALLHHALSYAKDIGCHNVTLNVWSCNPSAIKFYETCGFKPQKIYMEMPINP